MIVLIRKAISTLFNSKLKIFVMLFSTIAFLLILFPMNDLGDLVSSQAARVSGNRLFLQFEELKMSLFPTPGMKFEQIFVETPGIPGVSAQEIRFTPSIGGLISKKPYGSVDAKGIFKGDVQINVKSGTRTENGVERQKIEINAQKLSLQDLREVARLPVMMKGSLNLESSALVDLTFTEQPDIDVKLNMNQFELPPSNISTPMGPLTLPDLKLSTVELKGRLVGGKLIIENGQIGKEGDELRGHITGNMEITLANAGGSLSPVLGGYTFNVNLRTKRNFQDRAALFLSFIDAYKTATPDGAEYKFKISAANTMVPPSLGAAR
ncbi:MAG TPA: type II secretion system protein GspN [Pseudobdellovibrionaceae bacterium]|jgi:type II secretion system protein N